MLPLSALTSIAAGGPVGFASLNGGTTGGGEGPTVVATTASQFQQFATQSGPLNILVDGTFDVGGVRVASDKTITGVGGNGGIIGSLQLSNVNNVIIRNLSISNPNDAGEGDAITLRGSENIWIDHNDIFNAPDGVVDIVSGSDFVTVSWNKIFYTDSWTASHDHRFSVLIGNGDNVTSDAGKLRVTMHDNYFGDHVQERMPRVRYGDVHVLNNYLNAPGSYYAVRAAVDSEVLVENNHFENIGDPYQKYATDAGVGQIEARGNLFTNSGTPSDGGSDDVFDPPYAYSAWDTAHVAARVLACAGVVALAGDHNRDGVVDAADYTVWRDGLGSVYAAEGYDTWRENYGATAAAAPTAPAAAPEPAAAALSVLAVAGLLSRRGNGRRRRGSFACCGRARYLDYSADEVSETA